MNSDNLLSLIVLAFFLIVFALVPLFGRLLRRPEEETAGEAEAEEGETRVPRAKRPTPPEPAVPPAAPVPSVTLEERLFARRRWSFGQRLVVSSEILRPPVFLRR